MKTFFYLFIILLLTEVNCYTPNSECPFLGGEQKEAAGFGTTNRDWWPKELRLNILRQNAKKSDPLGEEFNYAEAFNSLNYEELKQDIETLLTDSQEWWPADYGHYGPLMIRMAWHSAGTYRSGDGRGGGGTGTERFPPLSSWPDNVNLDKARILLWPIKQKYGDSISWADLMILTGNVALESMGFQTLGFGGGREDVFETEQDIYWGSEIAFLTNNRRYNTTDGTLEGHLGATEMGLIYVNPTSPAGLDETIIDLRTTFTRMAMNDEETVALTAGGHSFGKAHGAASPNVYSGPEPEAATIQEMSTGWKNTFQTGVLDDTISSGLEGPWTTTPIQWDYEYFEVLLGYEWEQTTSPGGANQWTPSNDTASEAPNAGGSGTQPLMMTGADIALREDPSYLNISRFFRANPSELDAAFARAWFKLTHRDLGPITRYLGPEVPSENFIWQDPLPVSDSMLTEANILSLKNIILESNLTISQMVSTAWASASTFRNSDKRGGANGARIALEPQKNWEVNNPVELEIVLDIYRDIKENFGSSVSLADLIVLGGNVGIELSIENSGLDITLDFTPGRSDALQNDTDIESFGYLEPFADGFRNYICENVNNIRSEDLLIDRANLLGLSVPQMTALIGGMRVLGTNYDNTDYGVFTNNIGTLSNDFFKYVLNFTYEWSPTDSSETTFQGKNRETDQVELFATRVDLIFGSNTELRAISEVFGADDGHQTFVNTFVYAWQMIMNADRFDLGS